MKLINLNPEDYKNVKKSQFPQVRVATNGRFALNKSAIQFLSLQNENSLVIAYNEDRSRVFLAKAAGGFILKGKNDNSLIFSSSILCGELIKMTPGKDIKSCSYHIHQVPEFANGDKYYEILIKHP